MALLNPPNIIPEATRIILEQAFATPDQPTSGLAGMLAPGPIGKDDKKVAIDTIGAARTLGLLETGPEGGHVVASALATELSKDGTLHRYGWGKHIRAACLGRTTTLDFDGDAADDDEAWTSGASDFLRAASWLLAQDALGPALTWNRIQEAQVEQIGQGRDRAWPILNDTRHGPAFRWMVATGLAVGWPGNPKIIPTPAVRDVVAAMQPGRMAIDDLLDHLGAEIPVLWRGRFRAALTEWLGEDPDPQVRAGGMDSSVAMALLTLEDQEKITMTAESDTSSISIFPTLGNVRSVTDVVVNP